MTHYVLRLTVDFIYEQSYNDALPADERLAHDKFFLTEHLCRDDLIDHLASEVERDTERGVCNRDWRSEVEILREATPEDMERMCGSMQAVKARSL